jgi:hypothetical protein
MAKGIKVGDEVAITATVRKRVTEDRVSVSIPNYGFPHSIIDRTSTLKKGQPIELIGDVLRVDDNTVTVNLSPPVTVDMATVRLVTSYVAATRKKPLVDNPT